MGSLDAAMSAATPSSLNNATGKFSGGGGDLVFVWATPWMGLLALAGMMRRRRRRRV